MRLRINGVERELPGLDREPTLSRLVKVLEMKPDRVAIERNGQIAPRSSWHQVALVEGDRLEIVQFVGGGR